MKTNQLLLGGGIVALIYILYKRKANNDQQTEVVEDVEVEEGTAPTTTPKGQPVVPKGNPTKPVIKTGGVKPPRPTKPIRPTKPTKLPPIKPTKPSIKPFLAKSYKSFSMGNINSELGI